VVGESRIAMWFVITAAVSLYIEAGVRSLRVGGKKHVVPFCYQGSKLPSILGRHQRLVFCRRNVTLFNIDLLSAWPVMGSGNTIPFLDTFHLPGK